MSKLRKATRKKAKIKIGISSPTGFGKTYSSLLLAFGLTGDWTKIAVIDTENNSSDLYAHLGDYNVFTMQPPYTVDKFCDAVADCVNEGMECIIVDSTYHYWHGAGGLLEYNSNLGGRFQDWMKTNPVYQRWLNAILQTDCHFICTSRKKQAYEIVEVNGRKQVEKKGMEDQVRDGFDYEMTIALNIINANHTAESSKDRTGLFDGKQPFLITPKTGQDILEWCETGVDVNDAVNDAIAKLAKCDNMDEFNMLKDTIPDFVASNDKFKNAGNAKFKELKSKSEKQTQ